MGTLTDDTLSALLDGPRARGAFLLRSVLEPPWALRIQDRAPLSLVMMVRGSAWVLPDGGGPVPLAPGAVAVLRGPDAYTLADDPTTPPDVVIHPDQSCTGLDGSELDASTGVRTWYRAAGGSSIMISGTYQVPGEVGRRLSAALPQLLVRPVADADTDATLVPLLAAEIVRDAPGQELVLDRLLDLLLVSVLREWLARPGQGAPAWYRAQHDPVVGPALRMLHDDPARPWTVALLASAVGVSRAALARRFTALVGEPPMAYLTGWRLALAADLLREPDATVAAVARRVGYASPFALSSAFKRVRGVSPQDHRRRVRRVPVPAPAG